VIRLNCTDDLRKLRDFLHDHLVNFVVPFWLRHAIDESGGINTCLRDDGTIVNRDKWLWSQWRAVWVFSKLVNRIQRKQTWLDIAQQIYEFSSRFGWDHEVGGWRLRVSHRGEMLDGCKSIYVDAFAIYGLTELAKATGRDEPVSLARQTADNVLRRLQSPHDQIPHYPYPIPGGARAHGIPMIFSLVFWELGQLLDEPRYRDAAVDMTNDVFEHFYRADRDLILERIAEDNGEYPAPLGTVVVPGHALEGMWFQIHIARDTGNYRRIGEACQLIRRHFDLGWDDEHGGLILAIDADGREEVGWKLADMKVWWPHTEALYALLLAYEHTRQPYFLDSYRKLHDYSFSHFPVPQHGEWTQNLDRQGRPIEAVPSLPVKDPFHLPRTLIYCLDVLDRLIERSATEEIV